MARLLAAYLNQPGMQSHKKCMKRWSNKNLIELKVSSIILHAFGILRSKLNYVIFQIMLSKKHWILLRHGLFLVIATHYKKSMRLHSNISAKPFNLTFTSVTLIHWVVMNMLITKTSSKPRNVTKKLWRVTNDIITHGGDLEIFSKSRKSMSRLNIIWTKQ